MGVFAVKNDVGIGTIVGSAVFNLCCIIGGTAMFTPTVLTIDWKPITRDSLFYFVSIVLMIWALRDGSLTLQPLLAAAAASAAHPAGGGAQRDAFKALIRLALVR